MAHYAYLNDNNIVVHVIVGKDETELIDGLEPEIYYAQGTPYTVKRTSYNARIHGYRKNYAGIGFKYDSIRDAFIPPKCHDEAIIDEANCQWTCTNKSHDVKLP
jgi:hypothetical protein